MGALIQAGQDLVAGTGPGQLNQYYGLADTSQTSVSGTSFANLSTPYAIPAGEAYAGAAYELECGGTFTVGSTAQQLFLGMALGGNFGSTAAVAASVFSAGSAVAYSARMRLVCEDGVNSWWGTLTAVFNGYCIASSNTGARLVSVSSAATAAIQAHQGSTTGGQIIYNTWTTFKKVA